MAGVLVALCGGTILAQPGEPLGQGRTGDGCHTAPARTPSPDDLRRADRLRSRSCLGRERSAAARLDLWDTNDDGYVSGSDWDEAEKAGRGGF